jgi:hypothetical protein
MNEHVTGTKTRQVDETAAVMGTVIRGGGWICCLADG